MRVLLDVRCIGYIAYPYFSSYREANLMERVWVIETQSLAWEARVIPLYDTRLSRLKSV